MYMQSKTLKTRKTIQRIYLTITIFYGFFPIPWQSECKECALHPRERNPFFNILSVKRTEKNKKSLHELYFVKHVTQTHLIFLIACMVIYLTKGQGHYTVSFHVLNTLKQRKYICIIIHNTGKNIVIRNVCMPCSAHKSPLVLISGH